MSPPGKGVGANFHCKPRYHYLLSQVTIHALNPVMVTVSRHRQASGPWELAGTVESRGPQAS